MPFRPLFVLLLLLLLLLPLPVPPSSLPLAQAAHAVLQLQDTGKPVYKVKNVSLNALCELYNAPVNPMKEQVKNIYRRDKKFIIIIIIR